MDGTKHHVPVEGSKPGAVDNFYVLFGDGHPTGRSVNHKSGVDEKWKSKGYALSSEQKAGLQAEAAASLAWPGLAWPGLAWPGAPRRW